MLTRSAPVPIAPMGEVDVPDIASIDAASFPASRGATHEDSAAQLREELARPWSHTWVARGEHGRPVAFVLYWQVMDEIHVLNVATAVTERRRGYARALMEHMIAGARASGVRLMLLEVRCSNEPALLLYRTLGFYASGLRRNYYPDGEDAIEMVLSFDPASGTPLARPDAADELG